MRIWDIIPDIFEGSGADSELQGGGVLRIQGSVILIALLGLCAAQTDAALPAPECCRARAHTAALRTIVRALARVANLLLAYAAIIENSSLIQIYVWYTLASVVMGFVVAIVDMLLGVQHRERGCIANFISEVLLLFVLSRCLPLVDMYRQQINEQGQAKYSV